MATLFHGLLEGHHRLVFSHPSLGLSVLLRAFQDRTTSMRQTPRLLVVISTPRKQAHFLCRAWIDSKPHSGNDYLLQIEQFNDLYSYQADETEETSNYDLGVLGAFRARRFNESISTNPYFFNGPFAGVSVQAAAYTFIYRFMANHSSEFPEGRLSQNVLKSFFSITGEPGSFQYVSFVQ